MAYRKDFDELKNLETSGIKSTNTYDEIKTINKFQIIENQNFHTNNHSYIFITAPDLNLKPPNIGKRENFFKYINDNEPELLTCLNYIDRPFIYLLTNLFLGLNLKDSTAKTKNIGETFTSYSQLLPTGMAASETADQITLSFLVKQDLRIFKIIKLWVDYIEAVRIGSMLPKEENQLEKKIDFLATLYYFSLMPDNETVAFYAKYTGVAPIAIPYSKLSTKRGESTILTECDIPFVYQFKEELNPEIIKDFNANSDGTNISVKTVADATSDGGTYYRLTLPIDPTAADNTAGSGSGGGAGSASNFGQGPASGDTSSGGAF